MTNLIERLNNSNETDIVFVGSQGSGEISVARDSWFETMKLSELYDNYGNVVEKQHSDECEADDEGIHQNCECEELEVKAHNFWNGSNWQSVVVESDDFDTPNFILDDEATIERYLDALKSATFSIERTGEKEWLAEDGGLVIVESMYQGHWEIYQISHAERF